MSTVRISDSGEMIVNEAKKLVVDTSIDLTGGTVSIRYLKPDKTTGSWAAAIVPGEPTQMFVNLPVGVIDLVGTWYIEGILTFGVSEVYKGLPARLTVRNEIVL